MKEKARELRRQGMSYAEIAEKLCIPYRRVRSWVEDIKLTQEQNSQNISENKKKRDIQRWENIGIDKETLKEDLKTHGLYGVRSRYGVTEGSIKYWAKIYNIEIPPPCRYRGKYREKYSKCSACKKEYKHTQLKKGKFCNTCVSKIRRQKYKIMAVDHKGGKCEQCGYSTNSENYAAFEFHHHNEDKETAVGRILNRKWEIIKKEVDKCQLLCSNCHRIIHSDYDNSNIKRYLDSYGK